MTYEIVCSKGLDPAKTSLEKAFLKHFASSDVQSGLEEPRLRAAARRGADQGEHGHRRHRLNRTTRVVALLTAPPAVGRAIRGQHTGSRLSSEEHETCRA
ncbi:hypothetical protein GCM10025868_28080 [Angustibacter aerolatus]|uniref:Uncharacterized protein n=1 Tax=Angustibacter aerolatus TaxID=1162965 RepID=A0ABQ6JJG8_9ACTN|nr:hypothetical protein GCM10025868_28080 [Angustibacter aerolatus]